MILYLKINEAEVIFMKLKQNHLVIKKNVLNELRANNMTLQELRFFSIYLSRINPEDISTRIVRFSVSDFQRIMELQDRIKIDYLKQVTNSLLCKVVNVPNERGGYTGFQLFKECTVDMDNKKEWYIEIDAHDKALPLMFEFKEKYFSYKLWNALKLKSSNQLRMYEILKQYEKIGYRIITVDCLKMQLGISEKEYKRFNNLVYRVIEPCKRALEENTDIRFTYEPYGTKGKGGKVLELKFNIFKNNCYQDQLTLDEFIEEQKKIEIHPEDEKRESTEKSRYDSRISFMQEACNNEFSKEEIIVLYNAAHKILPDSDFHDDLTLFHFFKDKYDELNMRSKKSNIKYRFNYLKKIFDAEI